MRDIYVIPKPGLIVRDPLTRNALPAEGATVNENGYWRRRLRDGDISVGTAKKRTKKDA